jgi:hypothetical protein
LTGIRSQEQEKIPVLTAKYAKFANEKSGKPAFVYSACFAVNLSPST